ncbi:hypothetical protein DEU56DRAFT_822368 [Suillus clintonianus]|uniref:uncharacterized protein n=1 Tax=Suillus clintonianus TaxID=1904413 RepID=UPI001B877666|nr:uncharacterized protein DEU56DRAFT_822368 [Suillus clintonianus]KAG2126540.1 hypothetical protein DEU56DRAFT_822368 [Suillus clintonianus]
MAGETQCSVLRTDARYPTPFLYPPASCTLFGKWNCAPRTPFAALPITLMKQPNFRNAQGDLSSPITFLMLPKLLQCGTDSYVSMRISNNWSSIISAQALHVAPWPVKQIQRHSQGQTQSPSSQSHLSPPRRPPHLLLLIPILPHQVQQPCSHASCRCWLVSGSFFAVHSPHALMCIHTDAAYEPLYHLSFRFLV